MSRHDQGIFRQGVKIWFCDCFIILFAAARKPGYNIMPIDKAVAGKDNLRCQSFL